MYAFISDPVEREFLRADPEERKSLSESMLDLVATSEPARLTTDILSGNLGRLTSTAYDQTRLVELELSNVTAITAALDQVLDTVKSETGVDVPNPARGGFLPEAMDEIRMEHGANWRRVVLEQPDLIERTQMRMFDARLRELTQSDKRVAAIIARSREENTPQTVARRAEEDFIAAADDAQSFSGWAAGVFGGAGYAALTHSPLTIASLAVGGGPATARTAALGIAQVAAREAGINVAITAAMQPTVQAWREEIGVEAGFDQAMANILFAAALGGTVGGSVEGLRRGIAALPRAQREAIESAIKPNATPDEIIFGMEAAGLRVSSDDAAVIRAGESILQADRMMEERLPGVPLDAQRNAMQGALARAQDPAALPPEIAYPVRPGVDDTAAIAILDEASLHPIDALEMIRNDPALIESAWSSPSPAVREAGAIATLGDEAFSIVAAGEVDPRHAALVARMSADPDVQAGMMAHLREERPATMAEANEILQALESARVARAAASRLLGVDADGRALSSTDDLLPWFGDAPFDEPPVQWRAEAAPARAEELAAPAAPDRPQPIADLPPAAAARSADDVISTTPIERGDGSVALTARGSAEAAGQRDGYLADIVEACRI
jgi:hypothetical protein